MPFLSIGCDDTQQYDYDRTATARIGRQSGADVKLKLQMNATKLEGMGAWYWERQSSIVLRVVDTYLCHKFECHYYT